MSAIKPHRPTTNECVIAHDGAWLYFAQPQRVIQCTTHAEVLPALREIEDLVNREGLHAAGFLSYEAASAFDSAHHTHAHGDFPLLWFGLYPEPRLITTLEVDSSPQALTWSPTTSRETYHSAIEQVRRYIADGQTYQVNYTMRLQSDFARDPWEFFLQIAQRQNNHAAFVDTGRFVIASASPELFFQLDGNTLTCRPMKGTTHRGRTTHEDAQQAEWLKASAKNRAENVMIVDMIRNDLGRIAKVGSVHVPELFTVEKYPTLWQMTSTVQAETDASLTTILTALFPCASITGAPKVSTMRIIAELETTPRNVYTGSIGYIAPNRKATFNVAIRTALIDRETHTAEYGVGGGIVWDSTSADEYEEALLKARVLSESTSEFSLLETMLWTPEEGFALRDKHITRLLDSAEYFGFASQRRGGVTPPLLETFLTDISKQFTSPQRVRLLLDKNGSLSHKAKPFQPVNTILFKAHLAKRPVDSKNILLFHKTTQRDVYDSARSDFPADDDTLLYNERGELTEFTIGNLVVELNGKRYTPPITCGLLAGTFRAHLLETGQVEECVIRVDELIACTKVFLVNSVRGWVEVEMQHE